MEAKVNNFMKKNNYFPLFAGYGFIKQSESIGLNTGFYKILGINGIVE
jgi:hypothetical protein